MTAFAAATTLGLLVLATLLRPGLAQALRNGNDAQRLAAVGEVLGVFLVAGATARGCVAGESVLRDAGECAVFGATALVASFAAGRVGVRLWLGGLREELARDNAAAAVAAAGHFVASSLVTSRAITGTDAHALGLSLAFFIIAQVTLLAFVSLFRALTTYDDAEQIQGENMAAALSYVGAALAVAIVVARAVDGDFEGWLTSLRWYSGVLVSLVALWPVRQLFVEGVLLRARPRLRGGALDAAIQDRRSVGMGALEAASYVATALVIDRVA